MFDTWSQGYCLEDDYKAAQEDADYRAHMAEDVSITLTRQQWTNIYYAFAEKEMLWRERSIGMTAGYDRFGDRWTEDECRAEMKEARKWHKFFGLNIPF